MKSEVKKTDKSVNINDGFKPVLTESPTIVALLRVNFRDRKHRSGHILPGGQHCSGINPGQVYQLLQIVQDQGSRNVCLCNVDIVRHAGRPAVRCGFKGVEHGDSNPSDVTIYSLVCP